MRLKVMGRMEDLVVGIAETLPCPVLLGVDWPYLWEIMNQTMEKTLKPLMSRHMANTQTEGFTRVEAGPTSQVADPEEALDLGKIIDDGQFHEEQAQEPVFLHIFKERLAKCEVEIMNLKLADAYPRFEERYKVLYQVGHGFFGAGTRSPPATGPP